MRRRIHACHTGRRIHASHMRRRIHACTRRTPVFVTKMFPAPAPQPHPIPRAQVVAPFPLSPRTCTLLGLLLPLGAPALFAARRRRSGSDLGHRCHVRNGMQKVRNGMRYGIQYARVGSGRCSLALLLLKMLPLVVGIRGKHGGGYMQVIGGGGYMHVI